MAGVRLPGKLIETAEMRTLWTEVNINVIM